MKKQNNSRPRSRLDLRIDPEDYERIRRAAEGLGVTITEYVLEAALARVREDLAASASMTE